MTQGNLISSSIATRGSIYLLEIAGLGAALYSCTKPFHRTKPGDFTQWLEDDELRKKAVRTANRLAWKNNGENKYLRMVHAFLEINAPRAWWSHFDTYKVGTVAQSESTTHTLLKKPLTLEQCEVGTDPAIIERFNELMTEGRPLSLLKYNLPEGFLQSRVVDVNYATLQTMWYQRHILEKLTWWKIFLSIYPALPVPAWLYNESAS